MRKYSKVNKVNNLGSKNLGFNLAIREAMSYHQQFNGKWNVMEGMCDISQWGIKQKHEPKIIVMSLIDQTSQYKSIIQYYFKINNWILKRKYNIIECWSKCYAEVFWKDKIKATRKVTWDIFQILTFKKQLPHGSRRKRIAMVTGRFFFSSRNTANIKELTGVKQLLGGKSQIHSYPEKPFIVQFIIFSKDSNKLVNFGLGECYYFFHSNPSWENWFTQGAFSNSVFLLFHLWLTGDNQKAIVPSILISSWVAHCLPTFPIINF